jgi:hypothetical protein
VTVFGLLRRSVSVICLGASALVLYNLYGDNSETVRLAETVACGKSCVRTLRAERSAFSQSFVFQTSVQAQASQAVRCERAYWLVGPYSCAPEKATR